MRTLPSLLLVDGDTHARADLRRLLERCSAHHYAASEADSGAEALRRCTTAVPACLLVRDTHLDMRALDMLHALRSGRRLPQCPVVVISDEVADARAFARAVLEAGAMECVDRCTLDEAVLIRVIENAMDRFAILSSAESNGAPTAGETPRKASRPSEAKLAAVIEGLPIGIGITDGEGRILSMNPEGLRQHGLSSLEEMLGHLREYAEAFELREPGGTILPVEQWPLSRALRGEVVKDQQVRLRRCGQAEDRLLAYTIVPVPEAHDELFAVVIHDVTEHQRAQARLHESESRYATLLESVDEGFCIIEVLFDAAGRAVDYRLIETNSAFERQTGLTDVVGKRIGELVPELDGSWFEIYGRVALTGENVRFENAAPAMNRWFDVNALRVGAPEERKVAVLFTDVTERKRVEAAMRDSEARARAAAATADAERRLLDAVLEAAAVGIVVAEPGGTIVRINPANARLWGPTPATQTVDDYRQWKGWWADGSERHGRPIEAHQWALARALRGETATGDVVQIEPFDAPGTRRTMINSGAPVRDDTGRVIGAVIAQMNITDLVETQAALRESEARFRALADNMSQLAWMADPEGEIVWLNQRWFEYTGSRGSSDSGWAEAHHPDHVERVRTKFLEHVRSGEPWEDTFPLRRADGEYRWFLSRAQPIRDDAGCVIRWFGTNTDITAQREAEDTLRQAVELRTEFISVASHELRTPLTVLTLQLEALRKLLLKELGGDAKSIRRIEVAIRQSGRLTALVDGLLDVSRLASGRLHLEPETFDLSDAVADAVERVADLAARADCELRVPSSRTVTGTWDRSRLDQVLVNLLSNAIKYGPGRPIEVTVTRCDDVAELTVRDQGIGIAADHHARIFERFERAVSSSHYGGLGLGLYITREIVQAHGGTVSVSSTPGKGATFVVRLPLSTGIAVAAGAEPSRSPRP